MPKEQARQAREVGEENVCRSDDGARGKCGGGHRSVSWTSTGGKREYNNSRLTADDLLARKARAGVRVSKERWDRDHGMGDARDEQDFSVDLSVSLWPPGWAS